MSPYRKQPPGINGVPCGYAELWNIKEDEIVRTKSMDPTHLSTYILSILGFISVPCLIGYGVWAMKKVLGRFAP
jgi:hypothetical protein